MLEQYAETAYRGKQAAKFRNEIATDERESMYCRYQSKQAQFPRGNVLGHCFDNSQILEYKMNLSGTANRHRSILSQGKNRLELPLASEAVSFIDNLTFFWGVIHISVLFLLIAFPVASLFLGDIGEAFNSYIFLLPIWCFSKILNCGIWPYFRPNFKLAVIFERKTGIVKVPRKGSKSFSYLSFEQFNAHYKATHNPKSGFPHRGFTLLHYKENRHYDVAYNNEITCSFHHWELLQNFMDVTQPLADIPQFEYYREFDKTTAEFDKANGRPKYFWYRVDKSFLKKMSQAKDEQLKEFNDDEQLDNLLMGKPIKKLNPPEIFKFPWKYAENIKPESEIKFGKTAWQKFTSFLMIDL